MYQTWEQQKGAALRLAEARVAEDQQRISQLEEVIIAQAQPFERDKVYNAGDIVDVGGSLFEALVDGADITRTDLRKQAELDNPEWADLEIRTRTLLRR